MTGNYSWGIVEYINVAEVVSVTSNRSFAIDHLKKAEMEMLKTTYRQSKTSGDFMLNDSFDGGRTRFATEQEAIEYCNARNAEAEDESRRNKIRQESLTAYWANHGELLDAWNIFIRVRNAFHERLRDEQRYAASVEMWAARMNSSAASRGRDGDYSHVVEGADARVRHLENRYYDELCQISTAIGESYRRTDAAEMSRLLAGFMNDYRAEVEAHA